MTETMHHTHGSPRWQAQVWDFLTRPHSSLKEAGVRHQAQAAAGVTLFALGATALGLFIAMTLDQTPTRAQTINLLLVMTAAAVVGYILSRTRLYMIGTGCILSALTTFGYVQVILGASNGTSLTLIALPAIFLISLLVLTTRGNIILAVAHFAFPFLVSLVFPNLTEEFRIEVAAQAFCMGLLVALIRYNRDAIERDRMEEMGRINKELKSLSGSLEQRVSERTRDMNLAAEVGRRISSVHDMNTTLNEAVELIGQHFDLYYTQIYLVDSAGRNLFLKAATGEAGKELLNRTHHLPLDLRSINGTAAIERKSMVVEDTTTSPMFKPNVLLPDTRSEMAVPLIYGDRVLGVLNLQSSQRGDLSNDNLTVFETLAGQLATALANAELFEQAQRSLQEVEAQNRRTARAGWEGYLDGIENKERVGYTYDRGTVAPLQESLSAAADPCVLTAPIQLSGEPIGAFQFAANQPWSPEDADLVNQIAYQAAAQLENLRLLDQAERYRLEAERAMRRLTGEEWETYLQSQAEQKPGFVYAQDQVQPLEADQNSAASGLQVGIKVHDEPIGAIEFAGKPQLSPEDSELVEAVSEQLGSHLENLRLFTTAQAELEERRRTETLLESQRRMLQAVLDNMPAGVILAEAPSGQPLLSNRRAEELLGRRILSQPSGEKMSENYQIYRYGTDELYPVAQIPIVAGMYGKSSTVDDMEARHPDGSRVLLQATGAPVVRGDGQVVASVLLLQDITELRMTTDELRRTESLYRQVLDSIADMILVKGDKSRIVWGNKAFRDMYGMDNNQLKDMIDAPIVEPDTTLKYVQDDDWVYKNGKTLFIPEEPIVRYDGAVIPVQTVKSPIFDENGRVIMTVGVSRDITEVRKTQQATARRAAELAQVAEIATTVSTVQNPDEMLQVVVNVVKATFDLYHAHVYLLNEAGDTLVLTKGAGEVGQQMVAEGRQIPLDAEKSLVARAARARQGVIVNDVHQDPDFLPNPLLPDTRSEMAVPMIAGDRVIGVMDIQSVEPNHFTGESMSIQSTLAAQIAVALQNARQYEQTQESERLIRTVIDSTPDWILIKDQQYRFRMVNKSYADSLHLKPEDILGKDDIEIGFPEELVKGDPERGIAGFWADDRAVMDSGEAKVIPHDLVVVDGQERVLHTIKVPVRDANGDIWGVLLFARDVTDREQLLAEMEAQRRTLQAVLDNMPVAVIAKDTADFRFAMWNSSAEKIFGIPAEAVLGKTDYDFYPKEMADDFRKADLDTVEKRQTIDIPEEPVEVPGEGRRLLHTVKVPVIDETGKPKYLLVVSEDITERKLAQDTIAKRAVELATVAEVSTRVTTIQNPDEMLQTVVDLTKQAFSLYHAHIYLLNEAGDALALSKGAGEIGRKMVEEGHKIALTTERSLVARSARIRQGIIVNDVREEPNFMPHPLLPDTRSEMTVPMLAGDRMLGIIDIQSDQPHRFTPEDVNIMTTLAAQVAVSLQNARSFARAQRQAEREALINAISERIQATDSVENALQVAVREIGRALGAQRTAIRLGLERKADDNGN